MAAFWLICRINTVCLVGALCIGGCFVFQLQLALLSYQCRVNMGHLYHTPQHMKVQADLLFLQCQLLKSA